MLTGDLLRGLAELEGVFANGALRGIRRQQLLGDGDVRQALDGGLGGRRGAVAVRIVLGEVLDQLLEARPEEVVAVGDAGEAEDSAGVAGLDHELEVAAPAGS